MGYENNIEGGTGQPGTPPAGESTPAEKTGTRKRFSAGQRMLQTAKPPSKGAGIVKKIFVLGIPLLILAIVVAGFFVKNKRDDTIWVGLLKKFGVLDDVRPKKIVNVEPPMSEMDQKYNNALISRTKVQFYLKSTVKAAEDQMETLTAEKAAEIVAELERSVEPVTQGIEAISAVTEETNKTEGTILSKVDNLHANEELQNQTKFRKELLGLIVKWKDIRDKKSAPPAPVTPPEEPKKEEAPVAKVEEPKKEEPPKVEEPKKEEPKVEEPKKEEPPKVEEPKKEEPPPPKKEEPVKVEAPQIKVADVLAAADKGVVTGSTLFQEVARGMGSLPEDQSALRALMGKASSATTSLTQARDAYASVRDKAPADARIDEKIGKIEKVLARLQIFSDRIKSKLK